MKVKHCLFASCLIVLLSTSASAQDGSELLRWCEDAITNDQQIAAARSLANWFHAGLCMGMMQGITKMNSVYQHMEVSLICLPGGSIKNEQAARVVIRYLREHPEKLHISGTELAIIALKDAFPCKR